MYLVKQLWFHQLENLAGKVKQNPATMLLVLPSRIARGSKKCDVVDLLCVNCYTACSGGAFRPVRSFTLNYLLDRSGNNGCRYGSRYLRWYLPLPPSALAAVSPSVGVGLSVGVSNCLVCVVICLYRRLVIQFLGGLWVRAFLRSLRLWSRCRLA